MTAAQIKSAFTSIGEVDPSLLPASLTLKLLVTPSSLRYFVLSQTHQQVLFFGNYALHHVNQPQELAYRLEKIFEKDEVLQLKFGQVLLGMDTPYSLVPSEMALMFADWQKQSQKLDAIGAELVFERNDALQQTAARLFGSIKTSHVIATFIKQLPAAECQNKLLVQVSSDHLDIIRWNDNGGVDLLNRYEYQTATDFIYYVLLVCNDLKIDRETSELVLAGEVDIQSKIYDMCYRYFRNISFIQKPEHLHFSKAFDIMPKHLNYHLYNLSA